MGLDFAFSTFSTSLYWNDALTVTNAGQFLPAVAGTSLLVKAAVAGMFGLGADSIVDSVMARFPMLAETLPPAPNGAPKI